MTIQWRRHIAPHPARLADSFSVAATALAHPLEWLQTQARQHELKWLLAHSDDGVNWGSYDESQQRLLTSRGVLDEQLALTPQSSPDWKELRVADAAIPQLRIETLQQARLFAQDAELLLWRDGEHTFHARLIRDEANEQAADWLAAYDEAQMLWGTHGIALPNGFTLLRDGAQGLRHIVPWRCQVDVTAKGKTVPPRLVLRHYLAQNEDEDFARVVMSRLTSLQ